MPDDRDRDPGGAPAREMPAPATAVPVVDLRDDVPGRHRPTRGVPREPDRHLASYRNRPARPTHRHDRPVGLLEVEEVRERDAPTTPGRTHATHARDRTDGSTTTVPATTAPDAGDPGERSTAEHGRRKFYVGELVVRRLRLRSVFKVALALSLCLFGVVMVAGALLWRLANEQGWVTNWTGFLVDIGFTDADVDGATLARASAITGGILVATATLLAVATACLYNQIAGLFGGVVVTFGLRKRRTR